MARWTAKGRAWFAARWSAVAGRWWLLGIPALAALGGWYTIFGDQGIITMRTLRAQLRGAQREEGQLRDRVQQLTTEQTRLKDPQYLEQVVRRELGYVRPGERIYLFTTPSEAPAAPSAPNSVPALAVVPPSAATPPEKSTKSARSAKTIKQPIKKQETTVRTAPTKTKKPSTR